MNGQARTAQSGSVLDRPSLLACVGGDEDLLAELTQLFMQECPNRLSSILQAVEGGDPAGLRRMAHQFRGSLALFGARRAVEAARQLEHMGQDGSLDSAREVCELLHGETQRLLAALGNSAPSV